MANLYEEQKKYKLAEEYHLMAIEKDIVVSMDDLATLYQEQGKYELSEKYYLMAIEKGYTVSIDKLECLFDKYKNNDLRLYHALICANKSDSVNIEIQKLEKIYKIQCFKNKKNLLGKIDKCPICFESTLLIPYECAHYICCSCYMIDCSICVRGD